MRLSKVIRDVQDIVTCSVAGAVRIFSVRTPSRQDDSVGLIGKKAPPILLEVNR